MAYDDRPLHELSDSKPAHRKKLVSCKHCGVDVYGGPGRRYCKPCSSEVDYLRRLAKSREQRRAKGNGDS